jgi:hypothetical protein
MQHALSAMLRDAMRAGLVLKGERIEVDVTGAGRRDRRAVAVLRLRRAAAVAAEERAAREGEPALRCVTAA